MKTPGMFAVLVVLMLIGGCASQEEEDRGFFTSGSREADQRAEQRMAKSEELNEDAAPKGDSGLAAPQSKPSLYQRLGGEAGVAKIVDDFVARALADPRVNWERKGVTRGGLSLKRGQSVEWSANEQNLATMKKHIAQFIAVATGGPATYQGKEMKQAHTGLHITNAEFDAAIGDLKAALDKLAVPTDEQKELLAIVESTRPQVVAER